MGVYGRQTEPRAEGATACVRCRGPVGVLEGVPGRKSVGSASARRMNCIGVRGEPEDPLLDPGEERMERGLCPLGVTIAKDGTKPI